MNDPQRMISLATLLAAVGLWLMLPRGAARGRVVGTLLVAVALGLGASQLPPLAGRTDTAVFLLLAAVTVGSAVGTITFRNPVYSAIWFGMTLTGTAGLFLLSGAQFLALATLVVYAGAILVTFLFALMLAQPEGDAPYDRSSWEAMLSAALGAVTVGALSGAIFRGLGHVPATAAPTEPQLLNGVLAWNHVARLGTELFSRHLISVEVAGTLLLAAVVGTTVIIAQGSRTQR